MYKCTVGVLANGTTLFSADHPALIAVLREELPLEKMGWFPDHHASNKIAHSLTFPLNYTRGHLELGPAG